MAKHRKPAQAGAGQGEGRGPARAARGRWRERLGLAIVLAVTAFLYAPALNHQFTNWDDDRQITANPDIRNLSPQGIQKIFSSFYVSLYQPLTSLAWAVEYRLCGLNPRVFHAGNVLLHLVNILLVYALVRSLAQNAGIALAATALFAVHPLQVEVVAWASSLSILLFSLFCLGAMIAYMAYARSGKTRYFVVALVLFLPALLAKTTAATLPLALLVIDLYLQRRISWRTLAEKIPFFVLSAISAYITMVARSGVSHFQDYGFKYSAVQRICIVCYSCLWYVGKLIFPAGLSVFYPFPTKPNGWLPVAFYLAPLLLLGIAVGIWFAGRYRRLLAFSALFMLASLLLVIQIIPISELMVCDRYAYLPCLGLFFLAGTMGHRIGSRNPAVLRGMLVGAVVILVALSGATYRRVGVWRDSMTLWNDFLSQRRDNWVAYQNRALAQYDAGDRRAAIADCDAALRLYPRADKVLNIRAASYSDLGDRVAALRDFDAAIGLNPDSSYFVNRGILKRNTNDLAGAVKDFSTVIDLNPRHVGAFCERADAYRMQGDWAKAIADYEAVLRLNLTSDRALSGRAMSYACLGDQAGALRGFDEAIRLKPDSAYFINRGILKRVMGDLVGAIKDFDVVIEHNPHDAVALCERADARAMQKSWVQAVADYEAVLRLNPGHAYATFFLGAVLVEMGDCERAVVTLNHAVALGCKDPARAYLLQSRAYQKMGRMDQAKEAMRRAQELGYPPPQPQPRKTDGTKP